MSAAPRRAKPVSGAVNSFMHPTANMAIAETINAIPVAVNAIIRPKAVAQIPIMTPKSPSNKGSQMGHNTMPRIMARMIVRVLSFF